MFLGHAVGSYSKGDPQLRRHCGKVYSRPGWFGHPHLQYAWQTGSRSVSGIKSVKIALKLGNLWAKSGKIGLRRPSWGRLTTLRFLIALNRAGWADIQWHNHELSIIHNQTNMRSINTIPEETSKWNQTIIKWNLKKCQNEIWNKTDELLICRIFLSLYLSILGLNFFCDHPNVFITIT